MQDVRALAGVAEHAAREEVALLGLQVQPHLIERVAKQAEWAVGESLANGAVLVDVLGDHAFDPHLTRGIELAEHRAQQLLLELVVSVERDPKPGDRAGQLLRVAKARLELVGELVAAIDHRAEGIVLLDQRVEEDIGVDHAWRFIKAHARKTPEKRAKAAAQGARGAATASNPAETPVFAWHDSR